MTLFELKQAVDKFVEKVDTPNLKESHLLNVLIETIDEDGQWGFAKIEEMLYIKTSSGGKYYTFKISKMAR